MSRSGANAARARAKEAINHAMAARISAEGILTVSKELYELEQAEKIEHAKTRILRLAAQLGLPESEPFVTNAGAEFYEDHTRVCIQYEGKYLINYYPGNDKHREALQLIVGACKCGRPALRPCDTLGDIYLSTTPIIKRWVKDYLCAKCERQ